MGLIRTAYRGLPLTVLKTILIETVDKLCKMVLLPTNEKLKNVIVCFTSLIKSNVNFFFVVFR